MTRGASIGLALFVLMLLVFGAAIPARAADQYPTLTGRVVDAANVIPQRLDPPHDLVLFLVSSDVQLTAEDIELFANVPLVQMRDAAFEERRRIVKASFLIQQRLEELDRVFGKIHRQLFGRGSLAQLEESPIDLPKASVPELTLGNALHRLLEKGPSMQ